MGRALRTLSALALVAVAYVAFSAGAFGLSWHSGHRTEIGYDSRPPNAVKCGPPHLVEINHRAIRPKRRERLTISVTNLVSNHDRSQAARVYLQAVLLRSVGQRTSPVLNSNGRSTECSSHMIIGASLRRQVSCRHTTRVLKPGEYELGVDEGAFGQTNETVLVYASHVKILTAHKR